VRPAASKGGGIHRIIGGSNDDATVARGNGGGVDRRDRFRVWSSGLMRLKILPTGGAASICAISMRPGLIPTAKSVRTTRRKRTSFRSSSQQRRAGIPPSRYLAQ